MNEARWLSTAKPEVLRNHVAVDARLIRLASVAITRHFWGNITDPRSKSALVAAEKYADARTTPGQLQRAFRSGLFAARTQVFAVRQPSLLAAWCATAHLDLDNFVLPGLWQSELLRTAPLADLLRDIFGNPFSPSERPKPVWQCSHCGAFVDSTLGFRDALGANCRWCFRSLRQDPGWLQPVVLGLAKQAYDGRADDGKVDSVTLLALADACEEAGCSDQVLLNHLRKSPCYHVRGCWALDLILDKERRVLLRGGPA
jgi:hypothetical protein